MICENVQLNSLYDVCGGELRSYAISEPFDIHNEEWRRPALIVCPGGNYIAISAREGEPVAMDFVSRGFHVFVLNYLCKPDKATYPEQLLELACSVDFVKRNSDKYNINPDEIFVLGFSAGGHLAGNLAVNNGVVDKYYKNLDCSVRAVALCYPVVSPEYGFDETHNNLLNGLTDKQLVFETSLDKQVSSKSVPSFVWTTAEDDLVPCINAMKYAEALASNGIDFELHVYPHGRHGMSTCTQEINHDGAFLKNNRRWVDECAEFFRTYCIEKY